MAEANIVLLHEEEASTDSRRRGTHQSRRQRLTDVLNRLLLLWSRDVVELTGRQRGAEKQVNRAMQAAGVTCNAPAGQRTGQPVYLRIMTS